MELKIGLAPDRLEIPKASKAELVVVLRRNTTMKSLFL